VLAIVLLTLVTRSVLISEVAADWHGIMVLRHIMLLSIATLINK